MKELQGLGLRVDLLDESADAVVDAEQVIGSVINGSPVPASSVAGHGDDDDEVVETFLDEADDIGEIEDGMSIQDIDEVEEIKEEV